MDSVESGISGHIWAQARGTVVTQGWIVERSGFGITYHTLHHNIPYTAPYSNMTYIPNTTYQYRTMQCNVSPRQILQDPIVSKLTDLDEISSVRNRSLRCQKQKCLWCFGHICFVEHCQGCNGTPASYMLQKRHRAVSCTFDGDTGLMLPCRVVTVSCIL